MEHSSFKYKLGFNKIILLYGFKDAYSISNCRSTSVSLVSDRGLARC